MFAPNVAFGSILDKKTEGWLGVSEVIFATCLCGVLFGLVAGQPLIIIGATGPILVFEQTIYVVSAVTDTTMMATRTSLGNSLHVL